MDPTSSTASRSEQVGESSNHSVGMATTENEAQNEHTPPASSSAPLALTDDATVKTLVLAGRSQQRRVGVSNRRSLFEHVTFCSAFSRVIHLAAKCPNESILQDLSELQRWVFIHSNKRSPIDVGHTLVQTFLSVPDNYSDHVKYNLNLICVQIYEAVGRINQAYLHYHQAKSLAITLDRRASNDSEALARDRKKKLNEILMKLDFQSQFQCNLIQRETVERNGKDIQMFLEKLSNNAQGNAEECRRLWRQIVLQIVKYPELTSDCAEWLLRFANTCERRSLHHANMLYVALNLFLHHYGDSIFIERTDINVLEILDEIADIFHQYGEESKQFSPIHKMSHVWGTAAVVYYLKHEQNEYFVCASMMRASLEMLGFSFCSSGIESLYILAERWVPEFFQMMHYDPAVKLRSPDCLNYFRDLLERTDDCVKYSFANVQEFVVKLFNLEADMHAD